MFVVSERLPRRPPVYRLKDQQGEAIEGVFYEPELQEVEKEDDVYQVDYVVKKRTRKRKVEYLVKWKGYPDKFNSWVPANDLKDI